MSLKFRAGDLTIRRIIEQETAFLPALEMFPSLRPELLDENRAWMRQAKALDETDVLILCFQSYLIRTPHHTILVDTCTGEDKGYPAPMDFPKQPWLDGFKAERLRFEDVDYVFCTHLHIDHVGWNTRLHDCRWVPTFPNARYLTGRREFEYWRQQDQEPIGDAVQLPGFEDSGCPFSMQACWISLMMGMS